MSSDEDKSLDRNLIAQDGKEIVTISEFLRRHVTRPKQGFYTFAENATSILKWLGVPDVGRAEAMEATVWLKANGFRAVHGGKVFKFSLVYPQPCHCLVVCSPRKSK
jgi:hypothetical protein